MANPTALRTFRSVCTSCRISLSKANPSLSRPFSQRAALAASPKPPDTSMERTLSTIDREYTRTGALSSVIPSQSDSIYTTLAKRDWEPETRHHLHVYAHKHNTHITLTDPDRNPMVSVSCGNIGFKKAARGSYDAAYQLAAFVMLRIRDMGWLPRIKKLELAYRGFGKGREAVTKAILGSEGKDVRPLIVKLSDSTRLKFGGTRSKKPRRLG